MFGVSPTAFSGSYRRHLPPEAVKQNKSRTWIHMPTAIRTMREIDRREFLERGRREGEKSAGEAVGGLVGDGGGAKERKLLAESQMAELDLAERRGLLVAKSEVLGELMRAAQPMRRSLEQLQRMFGNAAVDVVMEGWDEAARGWQQVLSGGGDGGGGGGAIGDVHGTVGSSDSGRLGGGDPAAGTADDAPVRRGGAGAADGAVRGQPFPRLAKPAPRTAAG